MKEFLLNNATLLTRSVEAIATLTGLVLLKNYKNTAAKYFIYFLIYLLICDFIGTYTRYIHSDRFLSFLKGTIIEKNHWWSTSYWKIGAIMFFAFYYYKILKTKWFKIIIKFSSYTFFLFSVAYILLNIDDFFVRFFPIISVFGAVIIFLCTILYFIELLQSDKILTFYRSLNFYISVAIFVWWLIITPLIFYTAYLAYEVDSLNRDWDYIFLKKQIYLFANIFMYLTFTFALIWCKPEND